MKITLKWATTDDLDLHVFDPSGQEIYYSQKTQIYQGLIGRLDIDANAGTPYAVSPIENIYWEDTASTGKYKIMVVLYCKRSSLSAIPFIVTIYPNKGISKIFTEEMFQSWSLTTQIMILSIYNPITISTILCK